MRQSLRDHGNWLTCLSALLASLGVSNSAVGGQYILWASDVIEEADNWNNVNQAENDPGCSNCNCNTSPPTYANSDGGAGFLTAIVMQNLDLQPCEVVTDLRMNAMCRYNNNITARVRMKVIVNGQVLDGSRDSPVFTSGTTCQYRMGDQANIFGLKGNWSEGDINSIQIGVRRFPGSETTLRVKALRLTVTTAILDADSDGVSDCDDGCPNDPNKTEPGECGCGVSDVDSDNDGVANCNDGCPNDPNKTEPGDCGCGVPDDDSDDDGVPDCDDGCPDDPNKTEPGDCGCGVSDDDSDDDGVPDCDDGCPDDPNKTEPGDCGCGVADDDSDGDGVADCNDACDFDPTCCTDQDLDGCDDCSVTGGPPDENNDGPDCDGDGVCEGADFEDCNENGAPDNCDVFDGTSMDWNSDGIPDECQPLIQVYETRFGMVGDTIDMTVTDLNNDGWNEIVVVNDFPAIAIFYASNGSANVLLLEVFEWDLGFQIPDGEEWIVTMGIPLSIRPLGEGLVIARDGSSLLLIENQSPSGFNLRESVAIGKPPGKGQPGTVSPYNVAPGASLGLGGHLGVASGSGVAVYGSIPDGGGMGIGMLASRVGDGGGGFPGIDTGELLQENSVDGVRGDLNGDGADDIVLIHLSGWLEVLVFESIAVPQDPGIPEGVEFVDESEIQRTYEIGGQPIAVVLLDMDGDGDTDVGVLDEEPPASLRLFQGNGDGTFGETAIATYLAEGEVVDLAAGDLDGDGDPDLALVANDPDGSGRLTVRVNRGDGVFALSTDFDLAHPARSVSIGEVTGVQPSPRPEIAVGLSPDDVVMLSFNGIPPVPGDVTEDGVVNVSDLVAVITSWGPCDAPCPPNCTADLNGDCAVGVQDLVIVIAGWS